MTWQHTGAGVDHWLAACTNLCSEVSPEEFTAQAIEDSGGYDCGPLRYVNAKEGWDTLLDCERMGGQIRDVNDEFKGAGFRDGETRLLLAYDYVSKYDLRVFGWNMKPSLHKEMKRLRVQILDRVMQTYCGEYKPEAALREGLRILGEIRETEAAAVHDANPHNM